MQLSYNDQEENEANTMLILPWYRGQIWEKIGILMLVVFGPFVPKDSRNHHLQLTEFSTSNVSSNVLEDLMIL